MRKTKTMGMLKRLFAYLLLITTFCLVQLETHAASLSIQNIHLVRVDELSDAQIAQFVQKYTSSGYTLADVEKMAKAKKMPAAELEKLKNRINNINTASSASAAMEKKTEENAEKEAVAIQQTGGNPETIAAVKSRVFGAALFANSKVSFEPSQSMATPRNYVVGSGDVVHVDVFGLSEASYDMEVSADGAIRVPSVGLVYVSGKTIEQVENTLRQKLCQVYTTIRSGSTSVVVSIGKIRGIKVYILGEVRNPGTYTLTSVSSVFNAMNACGGPSDNGTMRNVKLIRSGKEIATIDLYEFLLNGIMPSDVTLQDQDVIQVPTYQTRVTVNGFVKRDGVYELKEGETLKDLINYCGGFTDDAYTDRISVTRNLNGEKSVADVSKELFQMFTPAAGDVYQVGQILDKYTNRVQILGSVFRPGVYALEDSMTLKDLVEKANGLTEDAFMESATLMRLQDDLTPEIFSFNVKDLMEGRYNEVLRKEDIVTIGGKNEFEPEKMVSIYGAVFAPGVFPYYENMTLKDIVFLARGFKEEADPTKIEVVRRIKDKETLANEDEKTQVFNLSLNSDLSGEDGTFQIQPHDQVTIRQIEGYESLGVVRVLGEVRNAGTYAIVRETEKISDMMTRAGGVTRFSFPEGAFLIRSSNRTEAERRRDQKLIEILKNADDVESISDLRKDLEKRTDLVGIEMEKILEKPGSTSDIIVKDGDIIFVPKVLQTVTIAGSVQVPGMVIYSKSNLRKYIRESGGFDRDARKRGVYVAYSSGKISSTKHFLWWKNYPEVRPGAHIFVPQKPEEKDDDKKANATFFVSLFSSIATMASVIITAISVISK